jgi:hypothetical protein
MCPPPPPPLPPPLFPPSFFLHVRVRVFEFVAHFFFSMQLPLLMLHSREEEEKAEMSAHPLSPPHASRSRERAREMERASGGSSNSIRWWWLWRKGCCCREGSIGSILLGRALPAEAARAFSKTSPSMLHSLTPLPHSLMTTTALPPPPPPPPPTLAEAAATLAHMQQVVDRARC